MIHQEIQKFVDGMHMPLLQHATSLDHDYFDHVMPLMPYVIGELLKCLPHRLPSIYVSLNITNDDPYPYAYHTNRMWTSVFYQAADRTNIDSIELYPYIITDRMDEYDFQDLKHTVSGYRETTKELPKMLYTNQDTYQLTTANCAATHHICYYHSNGTAARREICLYTHFDSLGSFRIEKIKGAGCYYQDIPYPDEILELVEKFKPMVKDLFEKEN